MTWPNILLINLNIPVSDIEILEIEIFNLAILDLEIIYIAILLESIAILSTQNRFSHTRAFRKHSQRLLYFLPDN